MRTRNKLLAVWCMLFLVAGVIMGPVTVASAITLSFSNLVDAQVKFVGSGDTFSFEHTSPGIHDFAITGETPGGSSVGLKGDIDGAFQIGKITDYLGIYQTAGVTSLGTTTLSIIDASNIALTANIVWYDIFTFGTQGGENVFGNANLTGITYTGSNPDLQSLRDNGGIAVGNFTFIPAKTLTQLTNDGQIFLTSYSGTISFVPEPATVLLLGSGLVGLGLLRFRRRQKKS